MKALPGTILLAFAAMLLATIAGISLGVLAAIRKDTWMDTSAIFVSVIGISAPSFFMGIVIAYLFGFVFSDFTGLHMTGTLYRHRPLHRPPSRAAQPHPACPHPGHPALGHHRPANPRRPPRRPRPGLYPHRLCQRPSASDRHLETWPAKCAEPCDHRDHRLVCRASRRRFFCRIYFWLAGHRKVTVDALGNPGFPCRHGIGPCDFLLFYSRRTAFRSAVWLDRSARAACVMKPRKWPSLNNHLFYDDLTQRLIHPADDRLLLVQQLLPQRRDRRIDI